ncbi:hypothetical protein M4578_19520 [Salipiger sp. P9]|jgi:hypothetical protein|uniref:hypothetical protein n=1 Tax=Alphaproteobacteria TaxID=28211 RepID=UPI001669F38F|nr:MULTISPECIES: hypothetical protein [Rhodobacterales]MCR8550019.1 hypothetical protein [Salipiger pentaromativorans]
MTISDFALVNCWGMDPSEPKVSPAETANRIEVLPAHLAKLHMPIAGVMAAPEGPSSLQQRFTAVQKPIAPNLSVAYLATT